MIEIKEYDETYVEQISTIIIRNLLEVNVKDYGVAEVQEMAKDFTVEKLKDALKNRKKVFVAIKDNEVVGTAGIDVSWYNPNEYYILTVFVKPEKHGEGIGHVLIKAIEDYAIHSNFKKLIIPASITAHEFYFKLGYRYKNNQKVLNEENMYLMEKSFHLEYREIKQEELPETLDLVRKVFDEFEASYYSEEGVTSFYKFIDLNNMSEQYSSGSLYFYGCFVNDIIVGMIAVKDFIHISLLFVDKQYHKQGIARSLFDNIIKICKEKNPSLKTITVNSSPYAVKVYHKFGFFDISSEQVVDGIRFVPMELKL